MRTPYSVAPYGLARSRGDLGPSPAFGTAGYIFAYQDVRGRWMSEGEFVNMRPHRPRKDGPRDVDESTDAYDTIAWLIDRKSTRLNSSHANISYAVFCLKKKQRKQRRYSRSKG